MGTLITKWLLNPFESGNWCNLKSCFPVRVDVIYAHAPELLVIVRNSCLFIRGVKCIGYIF